MSLSQRFVSAVEDVIANYLAQGPARHLRDAVTLPGTWNPTTGEIDVVTLESLAAVDDDSTAQPEIYRKLQLLTPFGMQTGPRGHERCVLIPGESGQRVLLEHGQDDSPGANAGEPILVHRKKSSDPAVVGAIDASLQLTDDAVAGDGKAAMRVLVGALMTIATTLGFSATFDDNARRATFATPGGLQLILADDLDKILIGSASLGQPDSVTTQTDVQNAVESERSNTQAAIEALRAATQTALATLAAAVQPGGGVPAPQIADATIADTTVTGSSITESSE